jgi:outer membrane protein
MLDKNLAASLLAATALVSATATAQTTAPQSTTTEETRPAAPAYNDVWSGVSPWLVRVRAIYIDPHPSNGATGNGLVPADSIQVDSVWAPEVDISYFFTRNFALELVLTYPQRHDVSINSGPLQGNIGSIKQLPPTLLAQWHFPTSTGFKPYVGAGVTWFWVTNNDLNISNPPLGAVLDVRTSNWGFALQAGVDYAINRNWYLNADFKYIWVSTKITDTINANVNTTLDVNPAVWGVGVGYRF